VALYFPLPATLKMSASNGFDEVTCGEEVKTLTMFRLISLLLVFPVVAAAGQFAEEAGEGDIPRFSILGEKLYRGGQPTEKGFQFLKEKGIKTIINLRAEDDSEAKIVEKLGMRYVQIPVDEARPWSRLPASAIAKYFEVIGNPASYPIFFHCRRGADRTGAFAALYRIALQHWTPKKAYDEARDIGMRWYYKGFKSQIEDFRPPVLTELQPAIKPQ
jgi:protein tyrosine/serine phosphatase